MGIIDELDREIALIKKRRQNTINFLRNLGRNSDAEMLENLGKTVTGTFKLRAKTLKELRVAAIMDQFTLESYRPECQLLEVTPEHWKEEIETFQPELLFIESAWKGKDDLWYRKVDRSSKEMYELTSYCHDKNIPVVFWNKEDPIYTTQFMTTAALADYVFTTDIDCVQRYKTELGHDQVYHLHFAAQPEIHNPIEKYERKDKFCFAGAYYHRYPRRAEIFDKFAEVFIRTKGFDIYDRNYQNARPEHAFPERYNPYILGSLPSSQIDVAYKGYVYGINMNSVQQSQTMFARRAFEMLASNTITVGNYSRGIKNYFGDLTICTDDDKTLEKDLERYCADAETADKYRLAGLRKALSEHLYEDRLDFIVQKVFGKSIKRHLPKIAMIARYQGEEELSRLQETFRKQEYEAKILYLIGDGKKESADNMVYLTAQEARQRLCVNEQNVDYFACICGADYYGRNYLTDMALTLRYGNYTAIGKADYYTGQSGEPVKKNEGKNYATVNRLAAKRAIVSCHSLETVSLWDCSDTGRDYEMANMFAVDSFNYCEAYTGDSCQTVDDLVIADQGIALQRIEKAAEDIRAIEMDDDNILVISGKELYDGMHSTGKVKCESAGNDLRLQGSLEDDKFEYMYCNKNYSISKLVKDNKLQIKFKVEGTLDCVCVCIFFDENGNKLEPKYPKINALTEMDVPEGAKVIRIGFRPKGKGVFIVHSVMLGDTAFDMEESGCFLSRSGVLVLTNHYPSPEDLYRNMFVHKRTMWYKKKGYAFDVMRMHQNAEETYREFEGINIAEGQTQTLSSILQSGQIKTVCVHFLDRMMWNVLKDYAKQLRIIVWSHGADIQPYYRREFGYKSEQEKAKAKKASDERMDLWNDVFMNLSQYPNVHFVYVSQYFADMVFEDYKIQLPQDRYSIIHNCIDTDMFQYVKKDGEQRKKILSIRPYASNIYANDLMAECIKELSARPYFEELQFRIIGNGVLFDEITKPLKKFHNVLIEKKFLRQDEIAKLHREYGIFLVPTRADTQGVSRDEAMASGMVPVTNAVAAIPEFTDEDCAVLAPAEDYRAMAAGIDSLIQNEQMFLQMSENAAKRVRAQSAQEYTIEKELALIYEG